MLLGLLPSAAVRHMELIDALVEGYAAADKTDTHKSVELLLSQFLSDVFVECHICVPPFFKSTRSKVRFS